MFFVCSWSSSIWETVSRYISERHAVFALVRSSAIERPLMVQWIDSLRWTHLTISRSIQCSTTGITKAVVCAVLSVVWWI